MAQYKKHEGFFVLNAEKIQPELLHEINHYNGLIKTFEKSPAQQAAIINSEAKVIALLQKQPGIYPFHVVYGNIPLTKLLQKTPVDVGEFIAKLNMYRKSFGDAYFKKLLLFDPPDLFNLNPAWGWQSHYGSFYINSMQNNLFMQAVKTGNAPLVQAMLEMVDNPELKKSILMQFLHHKDQYIPLLEIAIQTDSPALVHYLLTTMAELGISKQVANEFERFTSSEEIHFNLLQKAVVVASPAILDVILKHKDELPNLFYVLADKSYPDYVFAQMSMMPVFIQAMTNHQRFEKIFSATLNSLRLDPEEGYFKYTFAVGTLVSTLSLIDLKAYIQHADFNSITFSKLLKAKLTTNKAIDQLSQMKTRMGLQSYLPLSLSTQDGKDAETITKKAELWVGEAAVNQGKLASRPDFEHSTLLIQLFNTAKQAHNYQALTVILYTLFTEGCVKELTQIMKERSSKNYDLYNNLLLIEAIRNQNSNLITYVTQNKFELKSDVFKELIKIQDAASLIFLAKELLHHLHANKVKYSHHDLILVLTKVLEITQNNKTDKNLATSIELLIDEIKRSERKIDSSPHFFGSSKTQKVESLLNEIANSNRVSHSSILNGR